MSAAVKSAYAGLKPGLNSIARRAASAASSYRLVWKYEIASAVHGLRFRGSNGLKSKSALRSFDCGFRLAHPGERDGTAAECKDIGVTER